MTAKLDYRWHLRQVMATRGMFATTDLLGPLAQRGIRLLIGTRSVRPSSRLAGGPGAAAWRWRWPPIRRC